MSVPAQIVNGEVVNTKSTAAVTEANKNKGSSLDKDAFLQLLVAQMKYQDPLEPTSNTEYIAQYATFSQVESLQNMASSMESQEALSLVGKYVTVDVESETGAASTVSGRVDYVEKSGSDTLLYIDGKPYNYANLNTVWDGDYLEAYNVCSALASKISALPAVDDIKLSDEKAINDLISQYDALSGYQKSYIGSSITDYLKSAYNRIQELKKNSEASKTENADEDTEASENVENI